MRSGNKNDKGGKGKGKDEGDLESPTDAGNHLLARGRRCRRSRAPVFEFLRRHPAMHVDLVTEDCLGRHRR